MCNPGDTSNDIRDEARALESRNGVGERRMNGNGNKLWDALWKILSLLVIPWATFMSWGLWQVTSEMKAANTVLEMMNREHDRRLGVIESQMIPSKRFYRWDGDALDERIEELEALHPRNRMNKGGP